MQNETAEAGKIYLYIPSKPPFGKGRLRWGFLITQIPLYMSLTRITPCDSLSKT